MKNQYFGDINDYRKYGILRIFSNNGQISTLVCWMLTPNDSRSDGRLINYLDNDEIFSRFDPKLYNILSKCIRSGKRNVDCCQEYNLIDNAGYNNSYLSDNIIAREKYFSDLYIQAKKYDLVFLDPDNGLEIKSKRKGAKKSSKYLYFDEIKNLYEQGQSLLLYQHFIREKRIKFIQRIYDGLKEITGCHYIIPLKTSNVVYFLIPRDHLNEYFSHRIEVLNSSWGNEIRRTNCHVNFANPK